MAVQTERATILIIGGSGFLSGTLARTAVARGYQVHIVTRGIRAVPAGVTAITADRKDHAAFRAAMGEAPGYFDLVVDCICREEPDALQDIEMFSGRCGRFVYVSTDSVYDPAARDIPQDERIAAYVEDGYGGNKRKAELLFDEQGGDRLKWTILRPCHIYGPGSLLGCLPKHARDKDLIGRMQRGEPLALVGGGRFLQQPLYVDDLVNTILACRENERAIGGIFNIAGPLIIETRRYYQIIADTLDVPFRYSEEPLEPFWEAEPGFHSFLCHRVPIVERMKAAGLPMPQTGPEEGLPIHVRSILGTAPH